MGGEYFHDSKIEYPQILPFTCHCANEQSARQNSNTCVCVKQEGETMVEGFHRRHRDRQRPSATQERSK